MTDPTFNASKARQKDVRKEASEEQAIIRYAKADGWSVFKLVFPGNRGAPDRMFIKQGVIRFVEIKRRKGGKLSASQTRIHRLFAKQWVKVYTVTSVEEIQGVLDAKP